jgi:hypothetical protein
MRKQQTTNSAQNRRFFALMLTAATATATISKTKKGKMSQFSSIYELLRT